MPIVGNLIKRGLTLGAKIEQRQGSPQPIQYQRKTLKRLIKKSVPTAFGQYYNFKDILKSDELINAFQANIPIHDYDKMYDKWWNMTLNGVENVSWKGKIKYFALSSGTSGAPSKHIPVTEDMFKAMRRASLRTFFALTRFDIAPDFFTRGMMFLGGSSDLQEDGGYYMGDLSGINASKVPMWLRPYYKPGVEISRINDWNQRIEEIAKQAADWDIGAIVGIPAWLQLMMEKIIEYHNLDHIHQIWPNLQVCVHGGVAFEPYKKGFEKILGRPLIYMDTYLASEGFLAYQSRPETNSMKLLLNNRIFFEFVPFNKDNFDSNNQIKANPEVLTVEEVEEGIDYALLISTCSGAWRYLIGDTIRFTNKEEMEIVITGRTKHFLSICGEHLSIENMNTGMRAVEEQLDINIREFTVAAVEDGNFFAHQWYIGCEPQADATVVKKILDEQLKSINADYSTERSEVLGMEVEILPFQLFYDWQRQRGKMGGQNKFPRVMKPELFKEWQAFVNSQIPSEKYN